MDPALDPTVWVNLKVIARLQPFQRLHTRALLFRIQRHKYVPEFLQRWWDGSSRDSDFGRLQDVVGVALQYRAASDDESVSQHMEQHLMDAVRGFTALKKTYELDTTMNARLDTLIEVIYRGCVLEKGEEHPGAKENEEPDAEHAE
jgi:hypothetical protein